MIHVGYHSYRLTKEADNPREVAFAEQWDHENNNTDLAGQLICLAPSHSGADLSGGFGTKLAMVRGISDPERKAVATVIQWLGSNVGMSFLNSALGRCGYKIVATAEVVKVAKEKA